MWGLDSDTIVDHSVCRGIHNFISHKLGMFSSCGCLTLWIAFPRRVPILLGLQVGSRRSEISAGYVVFGRFLWVLVDLYSKAASWCHSAMSRHQNHWDSARMCVCFQAFWGSCFETISPWASNQYRPQHFGLSNAHNVHNPFMAYVI